MASPGRPGRNKTARSFRQLRRFHHVINSDRVFGTHRLRQLLIDAGYDLTRDGIEIVGIPPNPAVGPNFGLGAAKALEEGRIDGFWANGIGAEIAVTSGVGTVLLDIRRGDGPKGSFGYAFASIATTDRLISEQPETAAAAVRAIVATQRALKANVALATEAGRKLFPSREAELIASVVARDLPYYDASILPETVVRLKEFCRARDLLDSDPSFEAVVAIEALRKSVRG
jgi:NitT/TauT family transport system substrate-binding protein